MTTEPRTPRTGPPGRGRMLIRPLRATVVVTLALAASGALLPGRAGDVAAAVMVGVLVGVPLLRVAFFAGRWWQLADRRYASVAALLLVEIGVGAAVALL